MADTFFSLNVHCVFSTKNREPLLIGEIKNRVWAFMGFAWQSGYGAFTVSASHIGETIRYIKNQEDHHRLKSFQEEYVAFLKKHGIQFDERYLWD